MVDIIVESDADSVFDESKISSAQQILNQGAGIITLYTRGAKNTLNTLY